MSYQKTIAITDPSVSRQAVLRQRYLAYKAQKEEQSIVDVGPHDHLLFGEHPTSPQNNRHIQLPGCP